MSKAKSAHFSKLIAEHSGDYRSLWKEFNKILHRCPKMHLPDHSSIATLANTFSSFFINKISVICSSFSSDSQSRVLNPPDTRKILQNLTCVTTDEVRHLVLRAPCMSSDLDPISTSLVKDCIAILITPITSIINLSVIAEYFPSHFKCAYVSPSFWKNSPFKRIAWRITGQCLVFSFLPKVLEKIVVNHLKSHINSSNTSNQHQSAYRKFQSTETAVPKMHDNILASMDAGKVTAVTLLYLSAASQTINHSSLLRRLDDWFGVTGMALDWFESYLTGRCQMIRLGDCLSSKADFIYGVPQGWVLGPLLFTLSLTISMLITASCTFPLHEGDSAAALNGLQSCLASVQLWMLMNKLKLNPDKIEFLLIGNERQRSKYLYVFDWASRCQH